MISRRFEKGVRVRRALKPETAQTLLLTTFYFHPKMPLRSCARLNP